MSEHKTHNAFFQMFIDSAREFKNIRSVIMAALLIALHTVFAVFLSVQVTVSLRISISFIVNVVIGSLFGPVVGMVCGAVGDIVQLIVKPTGPYFPGWTINAALACFIYGVFFYKKYPSKMTSSIDNKILKSVVKWAQIVLPVAALLVTVFAPFARITDKETKAVVGQGSGIKFIMDAINGNNSMEGNVISILILFIILFVVLTVLGFTRLNVVPLVASVFVTFAGILAMYTDRKTTEVLWGFDVTVAVMIVYIIFKIMGMYADDKIDMAFLLRTTIAIAVDMVLVNILLGTYWVSVMYGKGFAFYFTARLIKNLIQLPVNVILSYYVLEFIRDIRFRIGF